uniref:Major facilitator superfamily (MFS) profile domain-containing protein n=1 Tax=Biomphalaria glabrata TaxID=6526 RepID=A0A2C9LUT7_BIOGL
MMICISFVDCSQPELAMILLTLGISLTGFQYGGGLYMNAGDIAPSYAGVIYGISNTAATIPGFLAPLTIGLLTPDQTQHQWRMVFYISAAIYVFGTVVFVAFSDGNLQAWAAEQTSLGVLEPEETTLELKDIRAADSSEGQSNKC